MKNTLLSFCAISIVFFAASCSKKSSPKPKPTPPATAQVLFFNGCPGAGSIMASVNDTVHSGDSSIAFIATTGYQGFTPSSAAPVAFILPSTGITLASATIGLTVNNNYSVYAGGIITSPALVWTSDDLSAPSSGMTKIRFVNLSPDTLNESLYLSSGGTTTTIDSNISFKGTTSFVQVAGGTYKVVAQDPKNLGSAVTLNSETFASGGIYTIILLGTQSGSGSSALGLSIIANK